ncbi:MAG TPA: hypothetical protein VIE66_12320 [Methylocella sp.]|jgi:hypothetical protein
MKIDGAVAALGICMAASLFGTPHLLYEYECEGYDIRHCAYYTSCTYIGVQGWRKSKPGPLSAYGCPGVKMFALDWPPFIWRKG